MLTDVVGQEEGVQFLRRVAEGRCVTPLLLVGDEGVGRKFAFRQLAKELYCSGTRAPGCPCIDCEQIDMMSHPHISSVPFVEEKEKKKDKKKSNLPSEIPIDQLRWLVEEASIIPSMVPCRLLLIDGADNMSAKTADVILKTIEEPSPSARFFLLAQHSHRVPATIRSRCVTVRFQPLPESFVLTRVSERQGDPTKALVYARMGEGSVGRSLQYGDGGKLVQRDRVYSMIEAALRKDLPSIFSILETLKAELPLVLRLLQQLTHDILMAPHAPDRLIHIDLAEGVRRAGEKMSVRVWRKLADRAHELTTKLTPGTNLQFQIQTLFVETFFGG